MIDKCGSIKIEVSIVAVPLITRKAFGSKDYSSIFANLAMGQNLIGAFGISIIGVIYDKTGSYNTNFGIGIGLCVGFIVLTLAALSSAKKLKAETNH